MSNRVQLLEKIDRKSAEIVIIGVGYVGLPLAVEFAQAGFTVTGVDVNSHKIKLLNEGTSYIPDVPTTNDIPDTTDDRVNILPIVVFVLSTEDYAKLCAGDEN